MVQHTSPISQEKFASAIMCCFYTAGVLVMLVIYGMLQERIMTIPYGPPPMRFTDSVFLVFCNRVVAFVFAVCMVFSTGEPYRNSAPIWKYLAISCSNVYTSSCQYEALKYVSFPVQMLGKSFKMMPVMLWGMLVSGKRYPLTDWLVASAVTAGVTQFLLTGPISTRNDSSNTVYGLSLLAAFLLLDGFTSTFQEKLFREHATSKYNQMLYINLGSCVISSGTLLLSGKFNHAVVFAMWCPQFAWDCLTLSASAVGAQWFIYSQVKDFGALVLAATMNVRQIVSILLSYFNFGHTITITQIFALVLVFCALAYKSAASFLVTTKANPNDAERTCALTVTGKEEKSDNV